MQRWRNCRLITWRATSSVPYCTTCPYPVGFAFAMRPACRLRAITMHSKNSGAPLTKEFLIFFFPVAELKFTNSLRVLILPVFLDWFLRRGHCVHPLGTRNYY